MADKPKQDPPKDDAKKVTDAQDKATSKSGPMTWAEGRAATGSSDNW